jgi:hypothetical protein
VLSIRAPFQDLKNTRTNCCSYYLLTNDIT